jgi:DNA-binding transcriptional ArsR family regulator
MQEITPLFGSKTRVKILQYLLDKMKNGESNELCLRHLAKHINEQLTCVRREMHILRNVGIVIFRIENQKHIMNLSDNEALNKCLTHLFYLLKKN